MNNITGKLIDWTVRKSGSKFLSTMRQVLPIPVKRKLLRLITSQTDVQDEFVTSQSGHKFVDIAEPVFLPVRYEGEYEHHLSEVTRQLISEGDKVIDVGANFGWYSVLMANAAGDKGHVYAFEPNKEIYTILERNIAANDYQNRITLTKCGLGEKPGKSVLMADDKESAIGYVKSIDDDSPTTDGVSELGTIEIRQLDLEVADDIDNISFMKIDVEGFEPFVMLGAKKVMAADNPPVIQMEFNVEALERSHTDVDAFMKDIEVLGQITIPENGQLIVLDKMERRDLNIFIFPTKGRYKRDITSIKIA